MCNKHDATFNFQFYCLTSKIFLVVTPVRLGPVKVNFLDLLHPASRHYMNTITTVESSMTTGSSAGRLHHKNVLDL